MRTRLLAVALLVSLAVGASALEIGETAATFANPSLGGRHTFSSDILGAGYVVLDFFATDCEPCKEEFPELELVYRDFKTTGVQVIVFATDPAGASVVKPFFEADPTDLTILLDRYRVTTERYGVTEIPTVFLVDPEGQIVLKGIGYRPEVIAGIREVLASQ